mmetsp:Transcript_96313/g.281387  ORF Transcript_96313/g.281387 Transcript_96313/m.281387 type:complete len:334 (-) Transcript_96313:82-1083(-)
MELQEALVARMPSAQGLHSLYDALECGVDTATACEILETLGGWLRRSVDRTVQRMLADQQRHAVFVAAMREHGYHAEFARLACSAVGGAAYRCAENAGPLCQAGVVPEVARVMGLHGRDSVVMDLGCEALWRLAERGGSATIRREGGVELLLGALRTHRDNPFLQSNACSALCLLVEEGSPWLDQLRAEARQATATHVGHKPIFRAAEKLLKACDEAGAAPGLEEGAVSCWPVTEGRGREGEPMPPRSGCQGAASEAEGLEAWLWEVDEEGHLLRYLEPLQRRFADRASAVKAYRREGGCMDPQLPDDLGLHRLGHRRLFEVWFRDHSQSGLA